MATKARKLAAKDYQAVGKAYGSDDVAKEASEASARWARDSGVLAEFGFGKSAHAAFEKTRAEHIALCASRADAIAAKALTVKEKKAILDAAWLWVDKVESILSVLGRDDETVASGLNAAVPSDDAALDSGIGGMAELLGEVKARVPEDAAVEVRLGEVPEVRRQLQAIFGLVSTAKSATVADTAEIDVLDGQLVVTIRFLNRAARKAIRSGALKASLSEYRIHYLDQPRRAAGASTEPVDAE